MKNGLSLVLFVVLTLTIAVNSYAQEYTLTTTVGNTASSKSTIDLPALNGNPNAIIVATQIGTLNPYPIGAWYYNNKWNIFNITHAAMPIGATFKVQYFVQPDANHFLHIITTGSLSTVPRSYLDYPVLNKQPNAQFKIFQNHSSVYTRNPSEAKAEYEAGSGKWFIENVNGTALSRNTAYNIVIAPGALGLKPNTDTPVADATPKNPIPISPASTTPTIPVAPLTLPLTVVLRKDWALPQFITSNYQDSIILTGECFIFGFSQPGILKTDTIIVNTPGPETPSYLPNIIPSPITDSGLIITGMMSTYHVNIKVCNRHGNNIMVKGFKVNILVLR